MTVLLSVLFVVAVTWANVRDCRAGAIHLPRRASQRPDAPAIIQRTDQPLLFYTMIIIRSLALILVVLLVTGGFHRLIEWTL